VQGGGTVGSMDYGGVLQSLPYVDQNSAPSGQAAQQLLAAISH